MRLTIAAHISSLLTAMENCQKRIDHPISDDNMQQAKIWYMAHRKSIETLVKEHCASGSGFDNGTHLDFDDSKPNKLVFYTSFHHMTEGTYDGWTQYRVIIKPAFTGVDMTIMGKDRNDVKDLIYSRFHSDLMREVDL